MSQETTQASTSSAAKVTHVLAEIQAKIDEEMAKMSYEAIHEESDIEWGFIASKFKWGRKVMMLYFAFVWH